MFIRRLPRSIFHKTQRKMLSSTNAGSCGKRKATNGCRTAMNDSRPVPEDPSKDRARNPRYGILNSDPRTLSLIRVLLGILVQLDAAFRLGDSSAFYGAHSILPQTSWFSNAAPYSWISPYFLFDFPYFPACLLILQWMFGFGLMLGIKVRLTSFFSWFLLLSVQLRNPFILNGGDALLLHLLLWLQFLPCDKYFTLKQNEAINVSTSSAKQLLHRIAILGFSLQMLGMYVSTGVAKLTIPAWQNGLALSIALSKDALTTDFGRLLLHWYPVLPAISFATLILELVLAPLLISPWRTELFRIIVLPCLILFHLGTALCFNIGLFPFISIAGLMIFLPQSFWRGISHFLANRNASFSIADLETRQLKKTTCSPEDTRRNTRTDYLPLCSLGFVFSLFLYSHLTHPKAVNLNISVVDRTVMALRFRQSWNMFVRQSSGGGWHQLVGARWDGELVDLVNPSNPQPAEKPANVNTMFPNYRWRKLLSSLRKKRHAQYRAAFVSYLVKRWEHSREPEQHLESATWDYLTYVTADRRATTLGFSPEHIGDTSHVKPDIKKKRLWTWHARH